MVRDLPEDLVRDCLYNWLGYGNPNATYWFIGIEESLYRWEGFENVADVRDFLQIRREFDVTEDFKYVWEEKHGFNLDAWSGISTWLFQAIFLMAAKDEFLVGASDLGARAREFLFEEKKLGREGGKSLTGEMFPYRSHVGRSSPTIKSGHPNLRTNRRCFLGGCDYSRRRSRRIRVSTGSSPTESRTAIPVRKNSGSGILPIVSDHGASRSTASHIHSIDSTFPGVGR